MSDKTARLESQIKNLQDYCEAADETMCEQDKEIDQLRQQLSDVRAELDRVREQYIDAMAMAAGFEHNLSEAIDELKEAARLRKSLCEHGDDESPVTPAENYDKPLQRWMAVIAKHEQLVIDLRGKDV